MDAVAAYKQTKSVNDQALVELHAPMVKRIAHHLKGKLPNNVLLDDLIQAGMIGLLEASKKYDTSKGASFETYAGIRIRGNMLDEVRRNDWVPRSVYRNSRMISEAIKKIENTTGRDAKDQDVADALGINMTEYHAMLKDSAGGQLYGFDDLGVTDDTLSLSEDVSSNKPPSQEPLAEVQRDNLNTVLIQLIEGLPEREKLVLSLYYEQELNLKEIGAVLGVSESRVSQIHSQAMHRLKSRLPD